MRYGTITDATGPDVIARSVETFGGGGLGLRVVERDLLSARFESSLGHIALEAERTEDGRTDVTIETREYDREVQEFISSLPRRSAIGRLFSRLRR